MISSATLRKLADLNLSPEQMAGVLGLLADQAQAEEERKAAQRERTRKSRASRNADVTLQVCDGNETVTDQSRDNTGTVSLSPVPPSFPPHPPNNPLTPKPIQKNNSRGTRLPDDWQLTGPDLAYALSKGLTEAETGDLAERFKSWALSASGPNAVKRNWHQAFQGWVQRDGPKIIAARAGPVAKPLTEFQRKQQETTNVLSELRNSRNGDRGGGAFDRILPDYHRKQSEGLRSGFSQTFLALPRASGGRSS